MLVNINKLRQNIEKVLASEIRLEDVDKRSEELSKEREIVERLDKEYAQSLAENSLQVECGGVV